MLTDSGLTKRNMHTIEFAFEQAICIECENKEWIQLLAFWDETSQMFWIHGSESFLWTILFRVTVQRSNIMVMSYLSSKDAFESINFELWYYVWFTCRQMEKHSEIRIGTYNECSRKVKLTYFWAKKGRATMALHSKSWCGLNAKFILCLLFHFYSNGSILERWWSVRD